MGKEKINTKDFRVELDFEPLDKFNWDFVLDNGFDAWHYSLKSLMDREYENSRKLKTARIIDSSESNPYNITSITANKNKGITTVVFEDGEVQMSKLAKGDHYDTSVGVALCIAYREFGSKTKFKKFVEENAKVIEKKIKKEKNS